MLHGRLHCKYDLNDSAALSQFCGGRPANTARRRRIPELGQLLRVKPQCATQTHPTHLIHIYKSMSLMLGYQKTLTQQMAIERSHQIDSARPKIDIHIYSEQYTKRTITLPEAWQTSERQAKSRQSRSSPSQKTTYHFRRSDGFRSPNDVWIQ